MICNNDDDIDLIWLKAVLLKVFIQGYNAF